MPRVTEVESMGEGIETVRGSAPVANTAPSSHLQNLSFVCSHLPTIPPDPWLHLTRWGRSQRLEGGGWAARQSVVSRKPCLWQAQASTGDQPLGCHGHGGPQT